MSLERRRGEGGALTGGGTRFAGVAALVAGVWGCSSGGRGVSDLGGAFRTSAEVGDAQVRLVGGRAEELAGVVGPAGLLMMIAAGLLVLVVATIVVRKVSGLVWRVLALGAGAALVGALFLIEGSPIG